MCLILSSSTELCVETLLVGWNLNKEAMQPLVEVEKTVVAVSEAKCKGIFISCYSTKLTLMMTMRIVEEID